MTGLESFALIAKVVGSAVPKLIEPKVRNFLNTRRINAEIEKAHLEHVKLENDALRDLNPDQASQLDRLLRSPEFALAIQRIASEMFLSKAKSEAVRVDVENQILELVRLHLPGADLKLWTRIGKYLDTVVHVQVFSYIAESELNNRLSASSAAKVIPAATKHIAAGHRNVEVFRKIKALADVQEFADRLRRQIVSTDGTILLPHSQSSSRRVPLDTLYVEPQISINGSTISIAEVLDPTPTVLLGDPGGGKSTAAQKIVLDTAKCELSWQDGVSVPFLIILRDFVQDFLLGRKSLVEHIEALCRSKYNIEPPKGCVEYLLLNGHASLVLDGLDELQDIGMRSQVVDSVHSFCSLFPDAPVLVTTRRIGYDEVPLDDRVFRRLALGSFETPAVRRYTYNWFAYDETTPQHEKESLARAFFTNLNS